MAKSSIISKARNNFKTTASGSWILGLTTGIMIAAILALDLVIPSLVIVSFPLLILPILLSATLQHLFLRRNQTLTAGTSLRSFAMYFTGTYFGCFSLIFSLIKAFVCFFIIEIIMSIVASTIFQLTTPAFVETMNYVTKLLESNEATTTDLLAALEMNGGVLNLYMIIITTPSFFISALLLIFCVSRNSLSIYLRMNLQNTNPRFVRLVFNDAIRRNRFRLMGDYILLNWPLFIILTFGFSGGAVLGYFISSEITFVIAMGLVMGAFLSSFFLPFYFPNNEALFEKYEKQFFISSKNITDLLLKSIQENIEFSMEEKEQLERSLSEANSPLDDKNEDKEE